MIEGQDRPSLVRWRPAEGWGWFAVKLLAVVIAALTTVPVAGAIVTWLLRR